MANGREETRQRPVRELSERYQCLFTRIVGTLGHDVPSH